MESLTLPLLREAQKRIFALCDDHVTQEETLLAELVLSLRQVRDAFYQRNLNLLPTLQVQQNQLVCEAAKMTAARDRLRAVLAELLGVSVKEATLHNTALILPPPERNRLLQRCNRLLALVREADQLTQQNAALLSYVRGFFACLFAGLTGTDNSERYGPQGERHDGTYGPLLEARV